MKTHLAVVCLILLAVLGTPILLILPQQQPLQEAKAVSGIKVDPVEATGRKAPTITSGDNVYVVWWNGTEGMLHTNVDVFFRSSTDNGATFNDKINLSNTTDADSFDAEITAEGDDVVVTWWERNITSMEPLMKVSTDNGQTFGPMLKLATNGTIGSSGGSNDTE